MHWKKWNSKMQSTVLAEAKNAENPFKCTNEAVIGFCLLIFLFALSLSFASLTYFVPGFPIYGDVSIGLVYGLNVSKSGWMEMDRGELLKLVITTDNRVLTTIPCSTMQAMCLFLLNVYITFFVLFIFAFKRMFTTFSNTWHDGGNVSITAHLLSFPCIF